jgi:hypothetical protein
MSTRGQSTRVDQAYEAFRDAYTRFEYFVAGGTGALLAYAIQSYTPGDGPNAVILAPIAWVALGASLACSLWSLWLGVEILLGGYLREQAHENFDELEAAAKAGASVHERATMHDIAPTAIARKKAVTRSDALRAQDREKRLQTAQRVANVIRYVGLGVGFVALGVWKMLNL